MNKLKVFKEQFLKYKVRFFFFPVNNKVVLDTKRFVDETRGKKGEKVDRKRSILITGMFCRGIGVSEPNNELTYTERT